MSKAQRRSLSDAAAAKTTSHHPHADAIRREAAKLDEAKKQLHVDIPEGLHRQLRIRSLEEGRTMGEIVEELISAYLAK